MASSMVINVTCLVVICTMVLGAPLLTHAALTCDDVQSHISPCIVGRDYGKPCCGGIRTLNKEAKTTLDRQVACTCLKNIAQSQPTLNLDVLYRNCRVNLPYKLTPSIDCNKIQ